MGRNERALAEAEAQASQQVVTFYLLAFAAVGAFALLLMDMFGWHDLLAGLALGGLFFYLVFATHLMLVKLDRSLTLMDTLEGYVLEEEGSADFPG